jgi:outer membrane protein assembly factor BamD
VCVLFASCGLIKRGLKSSRDALSFSYNKVLKSNDQELMYKTAIDYYQAKRNEKALYLFNTVSAYYAGTLREDTISFYSAICSFRMGDFETSAEQFNAFRRKFGRSPFIEEAEYLIAMGYYYASPPADRDQSPSKMAILSFTEYLGRYPNSNKREQVLEYIDELVQKLWDKSLLNAKVYYNIGYYNSAIHAFNTALEDYPETNHREEILFLLTRSAYLYAINSIEAMQHTRYLDMVDYYYNLISEYPATKYMKESVKMYDDVQQALKQYNPAAEEEPAGEATALK